jgi:hypothetical protein
LLNWLDHKEKKPFIYQCISRATINMNHMYWQSISFNTNIAESAHTQAQRDGKHLTLVGTIEKGEEIDARFFGARNARRLMGV